MVGWNVHILRSDELGFTGYILPGANVILGAQVIVSMFGAIPVVGDTLQQWLLGDFNFRMHSLTARLSRGDRCFYRCCIWDTLSLHETGSNNPDGIEIKENKNQRRIFR